MADYSDYLDELKKEIERSKQERIADKVRSEAEKAQLEAQMNQMYNQMASQIHHQSTLAQTLGAGGGGGNAGGVMAAYGTAQSYPGSMLGQGINVQGPTNPMEEEMEEKKSKVRIEKVDIGKAKDVLGGVLKTSIVPFLWGPPGIGKSTLVREIAKENDWDLIDLRLSLLNPVDLRGLPVIDKKNEQAAWYPPSFLPKFDHPKQGILFLDEINLAPLSVQAAAYQLILDKRVGEYQFPPHWKIVAAGNRETDRANVYKMSAPLSNRFVHFDIIVKMHTWKSWAKPAGVRDEIIDFLSLQPSLLLQMPSDIQKAFPTPRSWAFTSELMNALGYSEEEGATENVKQAIIGTIGEGVGKEFIAFLQDYKLKALTKRVDEFIKTGKIEMPRPASLRYGLMMAIYDAYASGRVREEYYQKWYKDLSGEEKRTLDDFAKEAGELFARRKSGTIPAPNMQKPTATIMRPVDSSDTKIFLSNTSVLSSKTVIIFDNQGNIEVATFGAADFSAIRGLVRGQMGTTPKKWLAGAYVQAV